MPLLFAVVIHSRRHLASLTLSTNLTFRLSSGSVSSGSGGDKEEGFLADQKQIQHICCCKKTLALQECQEAKQGFLWWRRPARGQGRVGKGLGSRAGVFGAAGPEIHLSLGVGGNSWILEISLGDSNSEMDLKRQLLSWSEWAKSWSSDQHFTLEMEKAQLTFQLF